MEDEFNTDSAALDEAKDTIKNEGIDSLICIDLPERQAAA